MSATPAVDARRTVGTRTLWSVWVDGSPQFECMSGTAARKAAALLGRCATAEEQLAERDRIIAGMRLSARALDPDELCGRGRA